MISTCFSSCWTGRHSGVVSVVMVAVLVAGVLVAAGADDCSARPVESLQPGDAAESELVWVFFRDRGLASRSAEEIAGQLAGVVTPRSLARRERMTRPAGVAVSEAEQALDRAIVSAAGTLPASAADYCDLRDLPPAPSYIDAVRATGAVIRRRSRWLNAVSVRATGEQMLALTELPCVARLEPVAWARKEYPQPMPVVSPEPLVNDEADAATDMAGERAATTLDYGYAASQLTQIGLPCLHQAGYNGQGIVIAVLDTGFTVTHEAFNDPCHPLQVIAQYDFINDDTNVGSESGDPPGQHSHGTQVLSTIGAYKPGSLIGGAWAASFILCKTEDISDEYQAEEDNYVAGLEFAEQHGAHIATASLGYIDWYTPDDLDGRTPVTTQAVNIATDKGMICCNAAGNEGHDSDPATNHLLAPGDAFHVITCGAVDSNGTIASFSSDGPAADGRVKPELLARGVSTNMVSAYNNTGYVTGSGTSFATPLVAAAVACVLQAHPDWSVCQMRHALATTAGDYAQSGQIDPYHIRGYGIMNACAAAFESKDITSDAVTNLYDFSTFAARWNRSPCPLRAHCDGADMNADGTVDLLDLAMWSGSWLDISLTADLDTDTDVDLADFARFLAQWQRTDCPEAPGCDLTDRNRDKVVDINDLQLLLADWLVSD